METGEFQVRVFGGSVQFATDKGRPSGDAWELLSFDGTANLYVTASIPKGKALACWIINGVRYDFTALPKKFAILNVAEDLVIEAVLKKAQPLTQRTAEAIEAGRTGDLLMVRTVRAQLCHMLNDTKGGGGWITETDFTEDYLNRATKERETGGRITVKVKALVPDGKKVTGWRFNDMEFRFGTTVRSFVVRNLDRSMVYEPIFGKAESEATTVPGTVTYRSEDPSGR